MIPSQRLSDQPSNQHGFRLGRGRGPKNETTRPDQTRWLVRCSCSPRLPKTSINPNADREGQLRGAFYTEESALFYIERSAFFQAHCKNNYLEA
jgi:hypothetical protein